VNHVGAIATIFGGGLLVCVLLVRKFRMKSPTTSTLEFVINEALGLVFIALMSLGVNFLLFYRH
jgi:hypothetical protein